MIFYHLRVYYIHEGCAKFWVGNSTDATCYRILIFVMELEMLLYRGTFF
jgi:hypothetical protein